jgi:hypothetical protein
MPAVGDHWPVAPELLARLPVSPPKLEAQPCESAVVLNLQGSLPQILTKVADLNQADKLAEQRKKTLGVWAVVALIVGIFTLPLFFAGLPVIVLAVVLFWQRSRLGAPDLEDRKLEVVSGTLVAFGPELRANKPVKAVAEFAAVHQRAPVNRSVTGTGFLESKATQETFAHWWLSLEFTLSDGVTVTVDGSTHAKRKSLAKRKYTKVKERTFERLNVRLSPAKGQAFSAPAQNRVWGPQRFAGLTLARVTVRPNCALFRYHTQPATRSRTRAGWGGSGVEGMLVSTRVVAAVINSYKAVASANRAAA